MNAQTGRVDRKRKVSGYTILFFFALFLILVPASVALAQSSGDQQQSNQQTVPLGESLRRLSARTGVEIEYDNRLIEGKMAPPIDPSTNAEEGLRLLLQDTDLQAVQVDQGSFRIVESENLDDIDRMLVTGQRFAQERAVDAKRQAANVLDAIAADDIGRLPDRNIGDALSRLPGVSTDQFEGEARFINIRGLDSSLNNLAVNGVSVTTDDDRGRDGRRAALDGISTSGIAIIEVAKTLTPDMDGTGIGGAINLITPSAFDRPAGSYGLSFDTSFSEVADNDILDWRSVEAFGSTIFGDRNQFGVFLSIDNLVRDVLVRDIIQKIGWPGPDSIPDRYEVDRFPTKRDRTNLATNLEWKLGTDSEVFFRARYSKNDRDITSRATADFRVRGEPTGSQGSSLLVPIRLTAENEERRQRNESYNLHLGGRASLSPKWVVEPSLAYARSEARRPLWSKIRARTSNFDGVLDLDPRPNVRPLDPAFLDDPSNYVLNRVRLDGNDNEEDVWTPQIDVTWNIDRSNQPLTFKAGLKSSLRSKEVDGASDRFGTTETITLADIPGSTFAGPGNPGYPFGDDFLFDNVPSALALDWPVLFEFFESNPNLFNFQELSSLANGVEDDYTSEEDVHAGYLMVQGELQQLYWTAGLRVESTDFETSAFRFSELQDGSISIDPVSGSNSYTDYLLNFQGRYELRTDTFLRAAFTQSIGRPDFAAAAPIQSFEVEDFGPDPSGQPLLFASLDTGNPELDRFQADNFDLSLEYYPSETGLFAAAVFWKEIDNPIFNRRERRDDTVLEGLALEALVIDTFENAKSGSVKGIELTAQEQFRFLPAPLNNFGLSLNYTLVDSESDVIGREDDLPFFGQADNISNATLYYQQSGFEARLAWRYRDETLASVGGSADQDIYRDNYTQLDFKIGYRFANGLYVFGDIWNLTDEKPQAFQGDSSRLFSLEQTGRFFNIGLQWSNF